MSKFQGFLTFHMPPPHAAVPSMPAFAHQGVCDCSAALPRSARLDGITSELLNIPEAEQENERGSNRVGGGHEAEREEGK